ncbi:DUF6542 domain-containing protein [Kitasatospora sp. NPDC056808]
MAGQRARTPYQDAGPRTEDRALPAQRSWPAGAGAAGAPGRRADTAAPRQVRSPRPGAARRRQQARRRGGTAAAFAALLCSRTGRWWVVTAAPVVVLLTASGVEYLAHPGKYQGRNLGTGALRWVVGAFPVMAAAVAVALVVVAVRVTAARRRAVPERRRTGRTAVPAGRGRRG